MKSRFAGRCIVCRKKIAAGDEIDKKGTLWVHSKCSGKPKKIKPSPEEEDGVRDDGSWPDESDDRW